MDFSNKRRFFILGLGKSGTSVARLLAHKGFDIVVFDDKESTLSSILDEPDLRGMRDTIQVSRPDESIRDLRESDCIVVSPGVPLDHPLVTEAKAIQLEITGELEVAFHYCSSKIVGVTGTNGKSTVVTLIGDALHSAGVRSIVAGNIGMPFSSVVESDPHIEVFVLEISSFQLDTISDFKADVAVLLNVTGDHLDRYDDSFERYAESKGRILNRADDETFFVYNDEDAVCKRFANCFAGRKNPFSSMKSLETGVYVADDSIIMSWRGQRENLMSVNDFSPVGIHNLENALAAVAALMSFDIDRSFVRDALKAYHPLPHRMELTRVVGGVAYIDDSKATNVDAAIKSVRSVQGPVVVIMGGLDKNSDYRPLAHHLVHVKSVILIGEAAHKIQSALGGRCPVQRAVSMEGAVQTAAELASPGDTVLLAPACASFDMFRDYVARGEAFKAAVNSL